MSFAESTSAQRNILTDVISARVPSGFMHQVREAARAEGVRPGKLIRDAIQARIAIRVASNVGEAA
jgi:hypothetical protein